MQNFQNSTTAQIPFHAGAAFGENNILFIDEGEVVFKSFCSMRNSRVDNLLYGNDIKHFDKSAEVVFIYNKTKENSSNLNIIVKYIVWKD